MVDESARDAKYTDCFKDNAGDRAFDGPKTRSDKDMNAEAGPLIVCIARSPLG